MNWITIPAGDYNFIDYCNATTYFKQRYTASQTSYVLKFTSSLNVLEVKGGGSGYGPKDNIPNSTFGADVKNTAYYALEMLDKTQSVEIYAFKEDATTPHWIVNAFDTTDNENLVCLHAGLDINGNEVCMVNTDKVSNTVDILSFMNNIQNVNNNYGTDYIVQPLYLYDEKTHFYTISGNTALAVFTVIQVQSKKFLVIGKGICVEID